MESSPNINEERELGILRRAEEARLIGPDQAEEAEKVFRKVLDLGVPMRMADILVQRGYVSPDDLGRITLIPREVAPPPPAPSPVPAPPPSPPPKKPPTRRMRRPAPVASSRSKSYAIAAALGGAALLTMVVALAIHAKSRGPSRPFPEMGGRSGGPPSTAGTSRERVEYYFAEAREFEQDRPGDIEGIRSRYEKIESMFPGTPDAERARKILDEIVQRREEDAEMYLRNLRSRAIALAGKDDVQGARVVIGEFPSRYRGTEAEGRIPEILAEVDRIEERRAVEREEEARERRRKEEEERARVEALAREKEVAGEESDRLDALMADVRLHVMDFAYDAAAGILQRFHLSARSETVRIRTRDRREEILAQGEVFRGLRDRIGGAEVPDEDGVSWKIVEVDEERLTVTRETVRTTWEWRRLRAATVRAILEGSGTTWGDPLHLATFAYDHGVPGWGDGVLTTLLETDPERVHAWIADRQDMEVPPGGFVLHQEEWIPRAEYDHILAGEIFFRGEWRSRKDLEAELAGAEFERKKTTIIRARREKEAEEARILLDEHGVGEVRTLETTGDISRRVDITIISDGFTEEEASTVLDRARKVQVGILRAYPFVNYKEYINIHLVRLVEAESGINQPPDRPRRTKVGSILQDNILTCDVGAAWEFAKLAPDADLVVVIANVSGGRATGGGGVVTLNKDGGIGDVVIHELGHAYGGLDDEYVDPGLAPGNNFGPEDEAGHINTTRESDPRKVKWHYWNFPPPRVGMAVSCHEGAFYHDKGYYRPSPDCRMRNSGNPRFCVVCQEVMERRFYTQVEPLDAAWPESMEVSAWADEKVRFEVEGLDVRDESRVQYGRFRSQWYVNGRETAGDVNRAGVPRNYLDVEASSLGPGDHEVLVHVEFENERIRRDHGHLSSTRAWKLHVAPHPRPRVRIRGQTRGQTRSEIAFRVEAVDVPEESPLRMSARGLPRGAAFDPESGAFRWIPDRHQAGLHRVEFLLGDGTLDVSEGVDIFISGRAARNSRPFMKYLLPPEGFEGEALTFPVEAIDLDGDHLVYGCDDLPRGATIDAATGLFRWVPTYLQAGTYAIRLTVGDGRKTDEQTVTIRVRDRSLLEASEIQDDDIPLGLRSGNQGLRLEAMDRIREVFGETYTIYELTREMRFPGEAEYHGAIESLREALTFQTGGWNRPLLLVFLDAVGPYCRAFVDDPETLAFLEESSKAAAGFDGLDRVALKRIGSFRSEMEEIRRYNEKRFQNP